MADRVTIGPPGSKLDWANWGKPITDAVNEHDTALLRRVLARGKRQSNSSTTTTEVGVMRIPGVTVKAGRLYRVYTSGLIFSGSVVGNVPRVIVRYTTDGTTPTTGSTQLTAVQQTMPASAFPNVAPLVGMYAPATDQTLSLILTVALLGGGGNASIAWSAGFDIDLVLEDTGTDPGNTGINL